MDGSHAIELTPSQRAALAVGERSHSVLTGAVTKAEPLGAEGRWCAEMDVAAEACKALAAAKFAAERALQKALGSSLTTAQRGYIGATLADLRRHTLPQTALAAQTWDERQRALANGHATTEWLMLTGSAAHVRATELFHQNGYA